AGNNRLVPVQKVTDGDLQLLDLIKRILNFDDFLFQDNSALRYLNLMFNDIGTKGADLIAKALHVSIDPSALATASSLVLNLPIGNINALIRKINQKKLFSLIRPSILLAHNSALCELVELTCLLCLFTRLAVVSNSISGKGLLALSESMKTNLVLSNIYIWGNKFDEATCKAFANLLKTGRLKPNCTDVDPYEVDGHIYFAELSHGLKRHYYWTPSYGKADNKDANASLAIRAVTEQL
uniref:Leucine-rich repeat-containing protein 34 n=1 Tax=Sphenodon punctatus TaxID=8508 RepID=A0A8D0HFH3_SPHPU